MGYGINLFEPLYKDNKELLDIDSNVPEFKINKMMNGIFIKNAGTELSSIIILWVLFTINLLLIYIIK